jgi:hypothetical protein
MSAERALLEAYQEWHRLARASRAAIQTGNRKLLRECQKRVAQFQPAITRLTCETREEWRQSPHDFMAKEKQLQAIISRLMEITRGNQSLIRQRREVAQARLAECAATGHNLKRIKTYAGTRQSNWASFS